MTKFLIGIDVAVAVFCVSVYNRINLLTSISSPLTWKVKVAVIFQ